MASTIGRWDAISVYRGEDEQRAFGLLILNNPKDERRTKENKSKRRKRALRKKLEERMKE